MEETIGEGTFGVVKIATHILTLEKVTCSLILKQSKVAIKILDKDKIIDDVDQRRIAKELEIVKKLNHINTIKIYEVN